jgi:hypothetical protein
MQIGNAVPPLLAEFGSSPRSRQYCDCRPPPAGHADTCAAHFARTSADRCARLFPLVLAITHLQLPSLEAIPSGPG